MSVFYDSTDPNKFLADVKKLLSKEGIFLLEFADLASIIQNKMFDTICHEHLEYYSSEVIINLCKRNGLYLILKVMTLTGQVNSTMFVMSVHSIKIIIKF